MSHEISDRSTSPFPRLFSDLDQILKYTPTVEYLFVTDDVWEKLIQLLAYYQVRAHVAHIVEW